MVTFFTGQDLVSFGEYLLSDQRNERLLKTPVTEDTPPFSTLKGKVQDADIQAWLDLQNAPPAAPAPMKAVKEEE